MKTILTVLAALCVAVLTLASPAFALNDELECYKAKDGAMFIRAGIVFLNDQAILDNRGCALNGKLRRVCIPADTQIGGMEVNGVPVTQNSVEGPELTVWYACYRVKCSDRITPLNVAMMNRLVNSETDSIAPFPGEVCFPFTP